MTNETVPLGLGGHTFIEELGNDPAIDDREAVAIVEACLDSEITLFDTTFTDERIALGRALDELGRRGEATIIAWNFFGPPHSESEAYEPGDLDVICEQLRTDFVDCLVVDPVEDDAEHRRQLELARSWRAEGRVGKLGIPWPPEDAAERFADENPYDVMLRSYNVVEREAAAVFEAGTELGWETVALTPFVRGWTLDDFVAAARDMEGGEESALRARLADHMLRFSLFHPAVDRLVVGMRRPEWVEQNVESVRRGPLDDAERAWLERVRERAEQREE